MRTFRSAARIRNIALMISFFMAFSPVAANACSPARLTPEEVIENADHIIIAKAVKSKWVSERKPSFVNIVRGFFVDLLFYDQILEGETQFKIHRTIKGDAQKYITLRHNVSTGACGMTFRANANYLLFVSKYKNKYYVRDVGAKPFSGLSEAEFDQLVEMLGLREDDYVYMGDD